MADTAVLSMLCESTAIVFVNGVLYLYQFTYMQNIPLLKLLQELVIHTVVAVFHRRILGHRDSLSENSSYGCLAQKMEKTHFCCNG